jgi:alkylation response protein AidB-like acyl-CoA dehydrogenase
MEDEYEILENTVRDFNTKYIDSNALRFENENISEQLMKALSDQGFLSMTVQPDGKKGTDMSAYSIILETLAKSSPSVAVKTLLTNSFLSLVENREIIEAVSSGMKSGTVTFSDILAVRTSTGKIVMENGKVTGTKEFVVGSDSNFILTTVDSGELVLIKSGFRIGKNYKKLGFRSIGFSSIEVDSDDFEVVAKEGKENLFKEYDQIAIPVSAIAIGMGEAASEKAIEYSKVRMAFGHYLKDFQPLTFEMTSLVAEMNMLKKFMRDILSSTPDLKSAMFLKMKALRFAKDMAKTSLQIHGGYGYLEDFGIEKFYRDSMALSILFSNEEEDMERLSGFVFGSKAGFV